MTRNLAWAILFSPLLVAAQQQGMIFENDLTWQQILQKAKTENKYVFVDCYASWCGPCKWMDKNVYSNDTIADFMKAFVAVKIQMDSTKQDGPEIQRWYGTAHGLAVEYHIKEYPSFLVFSPDGAAAHKDLGAKNVQDFIAFLKTSQDPGKQFYTLLNHYCEGKQDFASMPYLVNTAARLDQDSLVSAIATNYMHAWLERLSSDTLFTKENLAFIEAYGKIIHSRDQLFKRYFAAKKMIDSVMGAPGYADQLIGLVIYNEEVKPLLVVALKDSAEPDWQGMERTIKNKYGQTYATDNTLSGRVAFYRVRKQWATYAKYFVRQMARAKVETWPTGPMTSLTLNNYAFEVFKYSQDKKELAQALSWVDRAIAMKAGSTAQEMDTKANLLYKLGRKREGLVLEAQSHDLAPKDTEIENAYNKMKNDLPTWPPTK